MAYSLRLAVRAQMEAVISEGGGSGSAPWVSSPPGATSWAKATGQAAVTAASARTPRARFYGMRSTMGYLGRRMCGVEG